MPGETPHPRTHPRGHAYGTEAGYDGLPLLPDNWHCNQAYLFGVDLYNYAYWWEAHEQWEGLWRLAGSQSVCGLYLRGLIQISAALIKWHQGNQRGTVGLFGRGRDRLEQVLTGGKREVYMGLGGIFCGVWMAFWRTFRVPRQWTRCLKILVWPR